MLTVKISLAHEEQPIFGHIIWLKIKYPGKWFCDTEALVVKQETNRIDLQEAILLLCDEDRLRAQVKERVRIYMKNNKVREIENMHLNELGRVIKKFNTSNMLITFSKEELESMRKQSDEKPKPVVHHKSIIFKDYNKNSTQEVKDED